MDRMDRMLVEKVLIKKVDQSWSTGLIAKSNNNIIDKVCNRSRVVRSKEVITI